jgi:2-polyprenyl-3-methyl-5-hydroxy-6-metoxy-1,4-benzoquinol methylase
MRMADRYVRPGDRLLDVGCHDGAFIESVRGRVTTAVGIDPLATPMQSGAVTILRGVFPADARLAPDSFDCVTMLATLEHVDDPVAVARACFRLLAPGGRLVVTVPHVIAHHLVSALMWLAVLDGMGIEGHRGFDVRSTWPTLSNAGFRLLEQRRFELGMNHLYVAGKPAAPSVAV